jgi:putative tricarboxylic transport membrane protein|tara:strand:+ start:1165 stop:1674 length:510 start_codon:yes stop_codon:yes gene_type:complete
MNKSKGNLFNITDTIIATLLVAMLVFLWLETEKFEEVSDLFAQNIPPQMFPQILLIIIGLMVCIIPFEHLFLSKSGKDIDADRKKKIKPITYGSMAMLIAIISFSEFLGAHITIFLSCLILPLFWGERNLKLLIPYVVLFPIAIILLFNVALGLYFEPGILGPLIERMY